MYYCKPPIPFNGNKYMWRNKFEDIIKTINNDDYIFIDLFGGSGLLSNWIHYYKPKSKVIYNDYDYYKARIDKISQTNKIFNYLRVFLNKYPYGSKINSDDSNKVIKYITQYDGYDEITINAALTYNGRAKLEHGLLWNKIPKKEYNSYGYLDGIDIVHMDWKELYNDVINKYDNNKLIFILDPPYLYSDKTNYQMYHFKLHHTLELIDIMRKHKYILFNGKESEFNKIIDILNELYKDTKPIEYKIIYNKMLDFTHSGKVKFDFMLYKL
jgi:predicted transcriptional regulator YdeE